MAKNVGVCVAMQQVGRQPAWVGKRRALGMHTHTLVYRYLSLTDCWPVCVAYASHAAVATWATPFVRFFFLALKGTVTEWLSHT
jgi:hypothetical protein